MAMRDIRVIGDPVLRTPCEPISEIDDRGARAAVEEAQEAGAPQEEIDELQEIADDLTSKRSSLFRGETLRGLLLTTYAWSTIGTIASIASWVAIVAGVVMVVLVILGIVHMRRHHRSSTAAAA